jgi:hypothetical protein
VDGVLRADPATPIQLNLSYDLTQTCLQEIEAALDELGLHLDNGLLFRIKRALHYYTEETFRENCDCKRGGSNCTDARLRQALRSAGARLPRPAPLSIGGGICEEGTRVEGRGPTGTRMLAALG